MANGAEPFYRWECKLSIFFLCNLFSGISVCVFCLFSNWIASWFHCCVLRVSKNIFQTQVFVRYVFVNIFSQSVAFLFNLFTWTFTTGEFCILMKSSLLIFFFICGLCFLSASYLLVLSCVNIFIFQKF